MKNKLEKTTEGALSVFAYISFILGAIVVAFGAFSYQDAYGGRLELEAVNDIEAGLYLIIASIVFGFGHSVLSKLDRLTVGISQEKITDKELEEKEKVEGIIKPETAIIVAIVFVIVCVLAAEFN
jgi:hypothetical protein